MLRYFVFAALEIWVAYSMFRWHYPSDTDSDKKWIADELTMLKSEIAMLKSDYMVMRQRVAYCEFTASIDSASDSGNESVPPKVIRRKKPIV